MRRVTLYTRAGCHLCERVHAAIAEVRRRVGFEFEVLDIDADAALRARYDTEVPVVSIDGVDLFGYAMDAAAFERRLRKEEE